MYWTFNNKVVNEDFNVELSKDHDDDGYWLQNITARNVCEPVYISCQERGKELLSYNISYCKQIIITLYITMYQCGLIQWRSQDLKEGVLVHSRMKRTCKIFSHAPN